MGTNWKSIDVQCPFYITEKDYKNIHSLTCEGLICKSCSHLFRNSREKDKHTKKYCAENYKKCGYYKSIMKEKYS